MLNNIESELVLHKIKKWANEYRVEVNDEQSGNTGIRNVLIRQEYKSKKLMVVLVSTAKKIRGLKALADILEKDENVSTFILNFKNDRTNRMLGEEDVTIFGSGYIEDDIFDFKFKLSPHSFMQVNPKQTQVIYEKINEYVSPTGNETALDLYCGVGTISIFLSQYVKQLYGIEVVEVAIKDAEANVKYNHINNVDFICGRAEKMIGGFSEGKSNLDFVVVDPPRKGCDETLLKALADSCIPKIIYVSCNPATLARDVKYLMNRGYSLKKVQPIDNFPQTHHVEAVALLSRA